MTTQTKSISLMASAVLLLGPLSWADLITFNVNQTISDMDATGLQNTQTLSGYDISLASMTVTLKISGDPLAFGGDFYASLQSENGGYCVLLNRVGKTTDNSQGCDMNGFDLTFTLGAADIHLAENSSPTYDADGRLTGTWGADGRNVDPDAVLDTDARTRQQDVFNGINPNGEWTLFVADMSRSGTAQLDSWGLDIQAVPEPATMSLLGLSGLALLLWNRRKTRR
jgi:subtilisin-like proprotein convertase family protein